MRREQSQLLNQPAKPKNRLRFVPLLLLVFGTLMFVFYGQAIADAVRVASYEPTPEIIAVNSQLDLSDNGQRVFYATHPAIEIKDIFNQHCQSTERTAAILGCYVGDRIYIYDVKDPELVGAKESTSAHEILHAAYARLNSYEKVRVDDMVNQEYQKIKNNSDIKSAMEYYQKAEPGEEINELHSIIGTTIKDLSPELETYYARYFNNRAHIVELSTRYNEVFDKLKAQSDELYKKIMSEEASIKDDMTAYDRDLSELNAEIQWFNKRANGGYYNSMEAFYGDRRGISARADALEQRRSSINERINQYNADIEAYNKLSTRAQELSDGINGVKAPEEVK